MAIKILKCIKERGEVKTKTEICPIIESRINTGVASKSIRDRGPHHIFALQPAGHWHCIACQKVDTAYLYGERIVNATN